MHYVNAVNDIKYCSLNALNGHDIDTVKWRLELLNCTRQRIFLMDIFKLPQSW